MLYYPEKNKEKLWSEVKHIISIFNYTYLIMRAF